MSEEKLLSPTPTRQMELQWSGFMRWQRLNAIFVNSSHEECGGGYIRVS